MSCILFLGQNRGNWLHLQLEGLRLAWRENYLTDHCWCLKYPLIMRLGCSRI